MAAFSKSFNQSMSTPTQMMWPSNLLSTYDYVHIDVEKFSSVRARRTGRVSSPTVSRVGESTFGNSYSSSRVGRKTSTKRIGTVMLPIPENIRVDDRPKWTDAQVGVLGRFAPELANVIANKGDTGEITSQVRKLAEVGKVGLIKDLIKNFGADPNAATANLGGKIVNPYVEQVFGGVDLRSFDFNWKLVPRNKREQKNIQGLIRFIRSAAMPDTSDYFKEEGNNTISNNFQNLNLGPTLDRTYTERPTSFEVTDRWLTVPNLFNIKWKVGQNDIKSLPKLKKCVCRSIAVEYTPDNVWATHMDEDGPAPVAYNLTASFGETEIITSADIKRGY